MRKSRLWLVLLLTLALMLPSPAWASYYDLYGPGAVRNDKVVRLGTLEMYLDNGRLKAGDSAIFSFPANFEFRNQRNELMTDGDWEFYQKGNSVYVGDSANYFVFPSQLNGENNGLYDENDPPFTVEQLGDNEILFTVNMELDENLACYFKLNLGQIYVPKDYWGEIEVNLEVDGDGGFIAITDKGNQAYQTHPTLTLPESQTVQPEVTPEVNPVESSPPLPETIPETISEEAATASGLWSQLQQLIESVYQQKS